MFTEKWTPTFRDWMGERDGTAFGQTYFANVIGRLGAEKLAAGRVSDAMRAFGATFGYSGTIRTTPKLLAFSAKALARRGLRRT